MKTLFRRSKKNQMTKERKYQELSDNDDTEITKEEIKEIKEVSQDINEPTTPTISPNSLEITEDSNDFNNGIDIKAVKEKETVKKPNKIMRTLNLTLNTSLFKKILTNKIEHLDLSKKVSISSSYISLCLVSEYLMEKLINLSYSDDITENDRFGLKSNFNYIKLENEILKNIEMKNNFIKYLYNFDKTKNYYDSIINGNIVRTFAKSKIDKSIILDKDLVNFICYIVNDIINTIITKSLNLLFYVNRKQLKPDIIKFVVSHEFTDSLYKEMEINLDKITELKIQDDKKTTVEHIENDDDNDSD